MQPCSYIVHIRAQYKRKVLIAKWQTRWVSHKVNKDAKVGFSQGGLPLFPQTWVFRHFCILCFLDYTKVKKNKKNMRTSIIDVKFDGESKSEVRIGLPGKENPKNAENCRKIIKLLLEKNDVKKYLVHQ